MNWNLYNVILTNHLADEIYYFSESNDNNSKLEYMKAIAELLCIQVN